VDLDNILPGGVTGSKPEAKLGARTPKVYEPPAPQGITKVRASLPKVKK
jgi:hypothetical protein